MCFRQQYEMIRIKESQDDYDNHDNILKIVRVKDFLRIFGNSINCIDFDRTLEDKTVDDDI